MAKATVLFGVLWPLMDLETAFSHGAVHVNRNFAVSLAQIKISTVCPSLLSSHARLLTCNRT